MDCPKCVGKLKEIEVGEMEGKQTFVDQCQICSGIWFDKNELDKVMHMKIKFVETAKGFDKSAIGTGLDAKKGKCPKCQKELERISAPNDDRIKMDYCVECEGCWLDGGELEMIQRGNVVERAWGAIKQKVSELFGRE